MPRTAFPLSQDCTVLSFPLHPSKVSVWFDLSSPSNGGQRAFPAEGWDQSQCGHHLRTSPGIVPPPGTPAKSARCQRPMWPRAPPPGSLEAGPPYALSLVQRLHAPQTLVLFYHDSCIPSSFPRGAILRLCRLYQAPGAVMVPPHSNMTPLLSASKVACGSHFSVSWDLLPLSSLPPSCSPTLFTE